MPNFSRFLAGNHIPHCLIGRVWPLPLAVVPESGCDLRPQRIRLVFIAAHLTPLWRACPGRWQHPFARSVAALFGEFERNSWLAASSTGPNPWWAPFPHSRRLSGVPSQFRPRMTQPSKPIKSAPMPQTTSRGRRAERRFHAQSR